MRRIWRAAVVLVSLAVVALPVTADTVGTASAASVAAEHVSVLRDGHAVLTTANSMSAGYVTIGSNETQAQGTFVLPVFTCTGAQDFDLSLQLEGPPNAAVGFVIVTCSGSGVLPSFQGFACAGPSGPCGGATIIPVAGDTITITDSMTASVASSTVDDVTTNQVSSTTGAGDSATTNSNFIVQRGSPTIPTFTKAKFRHCAVNGTPISANNPEVFGPMTNASGKTQVKNGPLNSAGNGFTLTFEHR